MRYMEYMLQLSEANLLFWKLEMIGYYNTTKMKYMEFAEKPFL